jgi:hypothetical protein
MNRSRSLTVLVATLAICVALLVGAVPVAARSARSPVGAGSIWTRVSSPNRGAGYNSLTAVATLAANDAWAVGHTQNAQTGLYQTLIQHWNGRSWQLVPSPNVSGMNNQLWGVAAVSSNNVWAVGEGWNYEPYRPGRTLTLHWNGSAWSIVPSPNAPDVVWSSLKAVAAASANDVWAVGGTLILHWDGARWSVVANPTQQTGDALYGVAAASANEAWAVGRIPGGYHHGGPPDATLVLHWDGTAWSVVASPNAGTGDNILYGVAASAAGAWAVGEFDDGSLNKTLVERWDGTRWAVVASPNRGDYGKLLGVSIVSASDAWAVGYDFGGPGGTYETLTMQWDGAGWKIVASPNSSGALGTLLNGVSALPSGVVWAVGESSSKTLTLGTRQG